MDKAAIKRALSKEAMGSCVMRYKERMCYDLARLIAIHSVAGEPLPGMPYGAGPASALEMMLDLGAKMGFEIHNEQGHAGHIQWGSGEKLAGILVHVDVVPAGDGWSVLPFSASVKDNCLYGRGAEDDKGPAIAALYGMYALKQAGFDPQKRVRLIIGTNEEHGMDDMAYYFQYQPLVDLGFSPDSEYPITISEKGILQVRLTGSIDAPGLDLHGGRMPNMVPDFCQATLSLEAAVRMGIETGQEDIVIKTIGKSVHAKDAPRGVNACASMLQKLEALWAQPGGQAMELLYHTACHCDGGALGIACQDRQSGPLTVNLGMLTVHEGQLEAVLDIRYPVTNRLDEIMQPLERALSRVGLHMEIAHHAEPLLIDEDAPLITLLSRAYTEASGLAAGCISTGGGTYARAMKGRGVAFGPSFGREAGIHQRDEHIDLDEWMLHAKICTQAIYEMSREA